MKLYKNYNNFDANIRNSMQISIEFIFQIYTYLLNYNATINDRGYA
jgi:hypothetical protein